MGRIRWHKANHLGKARNETVQISKPAEIPQGKSHVPAFAEDVKKRPAFVRGRIGNLERLRAVLLEPLHVRQADRDGIALRVMKEPGGRAQLLA